MRHWPLSGHPARTTGAAHAWCLPPLFSLSRESQVAAAMDLFGEDGADDHGREGWECQYCGRQFPFEQLALMQECEAAHERTGEALAAAASGLRLGLGLGGGLGLGVGGGGGSGGQRTPRISAAMSAADPYDHRSVSLQASPSHAAMAAAAVRARVASLSLGRMGVPRALFCCARPPLRVILPCAIF